MYIGAADQATASIYTGANGPAFSATVSASQSVAANTWTKINFDTVDFDTNTDYDTTNKRFIPSVAGYYRVNLSVGLTAGNRRIIVGVYKNGAADRLGDNVLFSSTTYGTQARSMFSCLIYMNGTTDYVEGWATIVQAGTVNTETEDSYFQAALVRAA